VRHYGLNGRFGGSSFSFTFSGTTADADPGDGYVRFNNADVTLVTEIYVDLKDSEATVITDWIDNMAVGSRITAYLITDNSVWAEFALTSVTTAVDYRKLVVTYVANAGAFTNGVGDFVLSYSPVGTDGVVGSDGPAGGGVSFDFTFSTTTTDADPGAGTIRLNHATYSLATVMYVDLLDYLGTTITTVLDSLDNSTNSVKGSLGCSPRATTRSGPSTT